MITMGFQPTEILLKTKALIWCAVLSMCCYEKYFSDVCENNLRLLSSNENASISVKNYLDRQSWQRYK